jgi:chaperone required for assembly of F1-ATPase
MSGARRKRFYTSVTVSEHEGGFGVSLDGRAIKTPAKALLSVPTADLAGYIAAEWDAQGDRINPEAMPATRFANAAIDKVRVQFAEVADMLGAYGETDLLCYRAEAPVELTARQAAAWDPLLDWAARRFGVDWQVTTGIMPTPQQPETLTTLRAHLDGFTAFQLTAFHDLVALPGSLVIGLAATENQSPVEDLWRWSRIDEDWQIEQWGRDDEADAQASRRHQSFRDAARFFHSCT